MGIWQFKTSVLKENILFLTPIPILTDTYFIPPNRVLIHTDYRTFVKKVSTHKILIKEMGPKSFWGQRVKPF